MKMTKKEKYFASNFLNESYIFPCKLISLKGGLRYRPDFYIPLTKKYIEVVGSNCDFFRNERKYKQFRYNLEIMDYRGFKFNENINKNGKFKKEIAIKVSERAYKILISIKNKTRVPIIHQLDKLILGT